MLRQSLFLASYLLLCGCGHDERLEAAEPPSQEEEDDARFDLADSLVLDALRDARTRRGLCNLFGMLASGQSGGDAAICQSVVAVCMSAPIADPDAGTPVLIVSDDLSALLGCPVTVTAIDACVAGLISVARETYADAECGQQPDEPAQSALLGTLSCAPLLLACPELVAPLLRSAQGSAFPLQSR